MSTDTTMFVAAKESAILEVTPKAFDALNKWIRKELDEPQKIYTEEQLQEKLDEQTAITTAQCLKTAYSRDDISHAIAYAIYHTKAGMTHNQILIEFNKTHKKN